MPKGGARVRSGPPPDPNALSRDTSDWVVLPASGRVGEALTWPLPDCDDREAELWTALWAKPQAVVWEAQHQELEVALYVRRFAEAEQRRAPIILGTLIRQMADSLGLTTPGMRCNRWRLGEAESAPPAPRSTSRSARDRFKVVSGDGA